MSVLADALIVCVMIGCAMAVPFALLLLVSKFDQWLNQRWRR